MNLRIFTRKIFKQETTLLNHPSLSVFLIYLPESGRHVTSPDQGFSSASSHRGESLGTRLGASVYRDDMFRAKPFIPMFHTDFPMRKLRSKCQSSRSIFQVVVIPSDCSIQKRNSLPSLFCFSQCSIAKPNNFKCAAKSSTNFTVRNGTHSTSFDLREKNIKGSLKHVHQIILYTSFLNIF